MFITYRRTGGIFALLTFAAVAFAATVLTIAVAAALLIVALGTAATVLLAPAVLPASWRHHSVRPATPWPPETIETTMVNPRGSSDEANCFAWTATKDDHRMTLLEWMSASWRRTTPVPGRGTAVALGGGRTSLIVDSLADAVPAIGATP